MQFTLAEQEILCTLDLRSNALAWAAQRSLAAKLAKRYTTGDSEVPRDLWKAMEYKKLAGLYAPPPDSLIRTKTVYEGFSWFNATRLAAIRIDGFLNVTSAAGFLPKRFGFLGLLYGVELLFDIGVVLYSTFRARLPEEEKIPYPTLIKERFFNVLKKDNRLSRMTNAAAWFGLNLACFFVAPWIAASLTIGGCIFDVAHIATKGIKTYLTHKHLFKKLDAEIIHCQEELESSSDKKSVQQKINALIVTKNEVGKKINSIVKQNAKNIFTYSLVVVGLGLLFFPPTAILGAPILGAGIGLIIGSVFDGLGKKIWRKLQDKFQYQGSTPNYEYELAAPTIHHQPQPKVNKVHSPHSIPTTHKHVREKLANNPHLTEINITNNKVFCTNHAKNHARIKPAQVVKSHQQLPIEISTTRHHKFDEGDLRTTLKNIVQEKSFRAQEKYSKNMRFHPAPTNPSPQTQLKHRTPKIRVR